MPDKVVINDVGPRDGLQNQQKILTVEERLSLVDALLDAQVEYIEVGAFVSPKAVPAMAGTDQIVTALRQRTGEFSALIPNRKGYDLARAAGATTVAMVLYGSEGMAQKNVKMSRAEVEAQTQDMLEEAKRDGINVIATIGTAFECPFDGKTDPAVVEEITGQFLQAGVQNIVIADTIGAADPKQVANLMQRLVEQYGAEKLACHFHDTRALGLANVYAALEAGIRRFDASIAGLGGCPFAPGASGNVATEDVVMMLENMGFDTGIDLSKLLVASDLAEKLTGTAPGGRAKKWLQPHLAKTQNAA